MTPILWGALLGAVLAALAGFVTARWRHLSPLGPMLSLVGVVGIVAGGLGWGAWMSAKDVSASVVQVRDDGSCLVRWMDRTGRFTREADVDCAAARDANTDVRVKAHTGPFTGRATAHGGPVRDLTLGWVPGIGTVLALAGAAIVARSRPSRG